MAETNIVGDLSWDKVAHRLDAGEMAILPVGSGAKQHGWHLPMCSDAMQAEWLAVRLAARVPALVWPTLTYGYYPGFVTYAGSCSLSRRVFEDLVREVATSLLAYGPRVLVLDTGIATIAPIADALARCPAPERLLHLKIYEGPAYRAAVADLETQVYGTHADELETSRLLAMAPERVAMARAAPGPSAPPGPGPMQAVDRTMPNFSASGCIGDPTAATAEKGDLLLAAMVEDMVAAVETWAGMDGAVSPYRRPRAAQTAVAH